jgi:hypothetical protein
MEKHSFNGVACLSGVNLPMVMLKPPIRTCTQQQQRANQCARKCDSDLKILECGKGITAIWFRGRMKIIECASLDTNARAIILPCENLCATSSLFVARPKPEARQGFPL